MWGVSIWACPRGNCGAFSVPSPLPLLRCRTYDKNEPNILCGSPFESITIFFVRWLGTGIVGLGLDALFNEDVSDQAVDDVCADRDIGAGPKHDS